MKMTKVIVKNAMCFMWFLMVSCQSTTTQETNNMQLIPNPLLDISCANPSVVQHDDKFYLYATADSIRGKERGKATEVVEIVDQSEPKSEEKYKPRHAREEVRWKLIMGSRKVLKKED